MNPKHLTEGSRQNGGQSTNCGAAMACASRPHALTWSLQNWVHNPSLWSLLIARDSNQCSKTLNTTKAVKIPLAKWMALPNQVTSSKTVFLAAYHLAKCSCHSQWARCPHVHNLFFKASYIDSSPHHVHPTHLPDLQFWSGPDGKHQKSRVLVGVVDWTRGVQGKLGDGWKLWKG